MRGKVVVVTGANGGIGKATAAALAQRGAEVVLACRNVERGEEARREIVAATSNDAVAVLPLDLASMRSVRAFAHAFAGRHERLDVLVNNAGVFNRTPATTEDGIELHFGVMHLGHFLLTHLLLDALRAAPAARVVNVSAWGHRVGRLDLDNLRGERPLSPVAAYCRAKLAQVIFTRSFAAHVAGTGVTAYSLHPGVIGGTNLAGEVPPVARLLTRLVPGPEQGAEMSLYVAAAPNIERHTGEYFAYRNLTRSPGTRPAATSRFVRDAALADRLWRRSAELCGIAGA